MPCWGRESGFAMNIPGDDDGEGQDGVSILSAATPVVPVESTARCAEVYQRFSDNPELMAIPVVDGRRPVGLVNRHDLTMCLAQDYGRPLYAQKPITARMDAQPLIVESGVAIEALEWMIAANRPSALTRGFIVVREGNYVGVGTALTLLHLSMARAEQRSRELQEVRAAAEAANRAKSYFLATMSHELRTPLNAIIGFSELMQNAVFGPVNPSRYVGYVQDIHASAHVLLALINDILDTAKIDSGKMELFEEPVDIVEQVTAALRMLAPRALSGSVQLHMQMPAEMPALYADRRAIKQILMNLIGNAIKFSPNGEVTVSAEVAADSGIALVVADTGIGMSPDEVEIALAPFGQIANRYTRSHDGTGLGLPLVKSLAELHGARVAIGSDPGVGTTVRVAFPASRVLPQGEPETVDEMSIRFAADG
jgi:two-component system cell cycle sensor histidine kinase PleC